MKTSWKPIQRLQRADSQPLHLIPHLTFTFTELVSFTFPLMFPQGGLRHISSRSLSVCFGLLSTSGQHLTSEQIRIQDPDNAEADAGLSVGSERVHTSKNYQQVRELHVVSVERI